MNIRVGHGIDIHQLKDNIPLILAGINIKSNFGIVGHSDGDVVIHAVVDSILGALSKGDIGTFFPSSDNRWKNANSSIFLDHIVNLMEKENYKISNIDINIILEKPFLNNYILSMRKNLSSIMNIDYDFISIKATTSDKLGFVGNKEGIMATSTVLLVSSK
jgi:2-C-methyl-D-erythritol 2,4-cyclodiphosphate synthase